MGLCRFIIEYRILIVTEFLVGEEHRMPSVTDTSETDCEKLSQLIQRSKSAFPLKFFKKNYLEFLVFLYVVLLLLLLLLLLL